MLRKVSEMIASYFISHGNAKEEDKDVYIYGIENLIYHIGTVLFMLCISIYLDNVMETIVFLITFKFLRNYTGGYHANTRVKCFITSVLVYLINVLIANNMKTVEHIKIIIILCAVSICLMIIFAPIENMKRKMTLQEKQSCKRTNRILLCLIVFMIFILFYLKVISFGVYIALALITTTFSMIVELLKRKGGLLNESKNY